MLTRVTEFILCTIYYIVLNVMIYWISLSGDGFHGKFHLRIYIPSVDLCIESLSLGWVKKNISAILPLPPHLSGKISLGFNNPRHTGITELIVVRRASMAISGAIAPREKFPRG